jgi:hypothetical protein
MKKSELKTIIKEMLLEEALDGYEDFDVYALMSEARSAIIHKVQPDLPPVRREPFSDNTMGNVIVLSDDEFVYELNVWIGDEDIEHGIDMQMMYIQVFNMEGQLHESYTINRSEHPTKEEMIKKGNYIMEQIADHKSEGIL